MYGLFFYSYDSGDFENLNSEWKDLICVSNHTTKLKKKYLSLDASSAWKIADNYDHLFFKVRFENHYAIEEVEVLE